MFELLEIQSKISIIIPSRTIDYLLEKCVLEIRKLYNSVSIVIVLDEVPENNVFKVDSNIIILKSQNRNMSAKRNLGVKQVNTKYIAFIDSDAYPYPNWIENAYNFLENNEKYSAVTGFWSNFPDDDISQLCLRQLRFSTLFTHSEWCMIIDSKATAQECKMMPTADVIMRKSVYDAIGGMNENIFLAEDNDLSERLIKYGAKIMFLPGVDIYHRENKFLPYFKKLYCMNYYYANTFINGKSVKSLKQMFHQFLPALGIIFFFVLWLLLFLFNISPYPILILPFFIFLILFCESIKLAKRLPSKKIKGFFILYFGAITFCFVCVVGTIAGMLNIPTKDIKDYYKHY